MLVKLPRSKEELATFFAEVIKAADVPDNDLYRELIATVIGQSPSDRVEFDIGYFVDRIQHIQAHTMAYEYIQECRAKQKAAAEARKQAETNEKDSASVSDNQDPKGA